MSIIFHHVVNDQGLIPVTFDPPSPTSVKSQGLLIDEDGFVHVEFIGAAAAFFGRAAIPIAYHMYGMAFGANGELLISANGVDHIDQGIPLAADGGVCVDVSGNAPTRYDQGLGFSASGALAVLQEELPPVNPPTVPLNLVVTPAIESLDCTWDDPTSGLPLTDYVVEYKLASAGTYTPISVGVVNAYTITGLTAGETYDVRVAATNAGGMGPYTAPEQGIPEELPTQVQNLVAVGGNTEILTSWDAVTVYPAVTNYRVEYRESPSGAWSFENAGTNLNFTLLGLTNGTTYDVRVRAESSAGNGPFSDIAMATPTASDLQLLYDEVGLEDVPQPSFWNNTGPAIGGDFTPTGGLINRQQQNGVNVGAKSSGLLENLDALTFPQPCTIYWAGRAQQMDNNFRAFLGGAGTFPMTFKADSFNHQLTLGGPTINASTGGTTASVVYAIVLDGGSSRIRAEGASTFDTTGFMPNEPYTHQRVFGAADGEGVNNCQGTMYTMRVYTGAHDTTTINTNFAQIRSKYGF